MFQLSPPLGSKTCIELKPSLKINSLNWYTNFALIFTRALIFRGDLAHCLCHVGMKTADMGLVVPGEGGLGDIPLKPWGGKESEKLPLKVRKMSQSNSASAPIGTGAIYLQIHYEIMKFSNHFYARFFRAHNSLAKKHFFCINSNI